MTVSAVFWPACRLSRLACSVAVSDWSHILFLPCLLHWGLARAVVPMTSGVFLRLLNPKARLFGLFACTMNG